MPLSWLTDFGGVMTRSVGDLADMLNVVTGTDPDDPTTAPADAERPADWRSTLDPNALRGKRIGYIPSVWDDPFGTTGTTDASKAALKYLTDAGATIVEMGSTVGDANTPPAPADNPTGNTSQEGWMQYIDAHPELAEQGFAIRNAVDVSCSQKKVWYTRAGRLSACAVAPAARMTPDELTARRAYRVAVQGQRQDVAGHGRRRQPRRRRRRLPGPAERHQPQRRRRRQGELRPPRHAGRRPGHPDRRLPGRLQRPRPADQPAAARPGVGRRQARRHGLRVRAARDQGRQGPRRAPTTAPALTFVTETRRDGRRHRSRRRCR